MVKIIQIKHCDIDLSLGHDLVPTMVPSWVDTVFNPPCSLEYLRKQFPESIYREIYIEE